MIPDEDALRLRFAEILAQRSVPAGTTFAEMAEKLRDLPSGPLMLLEIEQLLEAAKLWLLEAKGTA